MLNYFTIIIPTYNSEKYIEKTLQCVINQSYKYYELIIVDDGSNDNTVNVVINFFKNNSNISYKILAQNNSGAGSARNRGIRNAKYSWIAFLDSDDLWDKNKLYVVNEYILKNKNCNFLCHNESFLELNGNKSINNYSKNFNFNYPLVKQLFVRNFFSTSAIVCSKKILLKNLGFNESLKSAQDYEMWLRMSKDISLIFINEVLGTYIMRNGNISTSNYWLRLYNIIKIKIIHRKKVSLLIFIKTITINLMIHLFVPVLKKIKII